jgi:hypothetical protein
MIGVGRCATTYCSDILGSKRLAKKNLNTLKRGEESFKIFQNLPDTNHILTLQNIPEKRIYHLCRIERQNACKLLFIEGCKLGRVKLLGFVVLG